MNFIPLADKDDPTTPEEFKGAVISMRPFLSKSKPEPKFEDIDEVRSFGNELGRFHRPSKLAAEFPTPLDTPTEGTWGGSRQSLKSNLGKLLKRDQRELSNCSSKIRKIHDQAF